MNKKTALIEYLKGLKKVVLAFSGGVDSTYLLKVARAALGDEVIAITMRSPYIPRWELEEAKIMTHKLEVRHEFIDIGIPEKIKNHPKERCYLCKHYIFTKIKQRADDLGYQVIDGTNFDDTKDYRPGMKALSELGVKSPLLDCGYTKEDIRRESKELELPTWDKPAYACLLTRLPFGMTLEEKDFRMIEEAEKILFGHGIKAVRVRKHGTLARIEVGQYHLESLLDKDLLKIISQEIKKLGFEYVSLDMEGYKMGSFNGKVVK